MRLRLAVPGLSVLFLGTSPLAGQRMTVRELLALPVPPPDTVLSYGADSLQFGELRLPRRNGPHAVAVIMHGGCWLSAFNLHHAGSEAAALTAAGLATWTIEYRRVGNPGGGWPGTFQDVARGIDHLRVLAGPFRLDTTRVVLVGHSAGGHLALWAAARPRLPAASEIASPAPLRVRGVVSLAGVPDLRRAGAGAEAVCGDAISRLAGGTPDQVPGHYHDAAPIELLPLGVPQAIINGAEDQIVPSRWAEDYAGTARRAGDQVTLTIIPEAGHFEVIVPTTAAWKLVEAAVLRLVR